MICPKCSHPMTPVKFGGIEIDRCVQCRGLWFDPGEEETLRALEGSEIVDCGSPQIGAVYDEVRDVSCPRCRIPMSERALPGLHLLQIETCDECGGVYMDAGEFTDEKQATVIQKLRTLIGLQNNDKNNDNNSPPGPPLRPA